jgi:hypothetical protein
LTGRHVATSADRADDVARLAGLFALDVAANAIITIARKTLRADGARRGLAFDTNTKRIASTRRLAQIAVRLAARHNGASAEVPGHVTSSTSLAACRVATNAVDAIARRALVVLRASLPRGLFACAISITSVWRDARRYILHVLRHDPASPETADDIARFARLGALRIATISVDTRAALACGGLVAGLAGLLLGLADGVIAITRQRAIVVVSA